MWSKPLRMRNISRAWCGTSTAYYLFRHTMKNNHPHTSEVKSFIEELKEIKKSLAEDWQGMSEEQIMCLQEEVQDINDAIKRLLRKQHY